MKRINKNSITNIDKNLFDNKFLFHVLMYEKNQEVEVIFLSQLLQQKENKEILKQIGEKPAMYSNVYSPEDELEIFQELFNRAIQEKKRIHIVGITLKEEIDILERYYENLGFLREDINCFNPDFSIPYVTVSVKVENLMWKGSDYKAQREKIFFNPPIRESGQVKAMFKGINRGVISGIYINNFTQESKDFLSLCIMEEKILPIILAKCLQYNLDEIGIIGKKTELVITY